MGFSRKVSSIDKRFEKLFKKNIIETEIPSLPIITNSMVGVVKVGYLKKNRCLKKKFFVLREETPFGGPARLEYYKNEKKWKQNGFPKRMIVLRSCFSVEKRTDTHFKCITLCLYTKEDYFCLLFDTEFELEEWLELMTTLRRLDKNFGPGDSTDEPFADNVWHISILPKELGTDRNLEGMTGLCLCDKRVIIMKYPTKSRKQKTIEILASSVRRCGALETYFYLEIGQNSPFGSGSIWMDTWNVDVAKCVYETILSATSKKHSTHCRMKSSSCVVESQTITCSPQNVVTYRDENYPSTSAYSNSNANSSYTGSTRNRSDSLPARPQVKIEKHSTKHFHYNDTKPSKLTRQKKCVSSSKSKCNATDVLIENISSPRFVDNTDRISSHCASFSNPHSTIYEEESYNGDLVPYTPLDVLEARRLSEINAHQNFNMANNNVVNRSSFSSKVRSRGINIPFTPPTNTIKDESDYVPFCPGIYESLSPPDGYVPMKPSSPDYSNYMPMDGFRTSKQKSGHMLPRTEEIPEETPEGYVPMAPLFNTSDYVCMDGKLESRESGTPSTDSRFSDIHLDKVSAYLTPSKEDVLIEKPVRAYSIGSKPDILREKIDKIHSDQAMRMRAYSVGSRCRMPLPPIPQNGFRTTPSNMSERSDNANRMEIDFSCNAKSRRHYTATSLTKSSYVPMNQLSRSSPPTPIPSNASRSHNVSGCSPPKPPTRALPKPPAPSPPKSYAELKKSIFGNYFKTPKS